MRIVIIAAGPASEVPELSSCLEDDTYVIGVDGGIATAQARGVDCDVLIGDFDSLGYRPRGAVVHPPEKDFTDLELALSHANGVDAEAEMLIFGATGGRLDMTLQNVYLLRRYKQARLISKGGDVRYMGPGHFELEKEGHDYLSFIPLVETELSLSGVKYPLDNRIVPVGGSLTVSNEWEGIARITVHSGEVIALRVKELQV